MPQINEPLRDKKQTVKRIFQLAETFKNDLDNIYIQKNGQTVAVSDLEFEEFYNFVKSLPYERDIAPIEVTARPKIIIERILEGRGRDCKKAAILLGAYFNKRGISWRLATVSTRNDLQIHHIFPQVDISLNGEFLNVDATYSNMKLFQEKKVTNAEYFS